MATILSIIFAILIFSFLIFVHEFGHFICAKLSGVQVNEFAIFMGPAIWKKQIGETLYSIRTIPIGGYCAMEGEDEDTENPRSFQKAAWWKRLIILVAGAVMNFLAGILLLGIVYGPAEGFITPVVDSFADYCTIDGENGLQVGDRFVEVDGEKIYIHSDFSLILTLNGGDVHDIVVERDGKLVELKDFKMERHEVTDEKGNTSYLFGFTFGTMDGSFANTSRFIGNTIVSWIRSIRLSLSMLFTGKAGFQDLSGPVGIVGQMTDVATSSATTMDAVLNLLFFGAFIAVNLGIMNLLPIPALDGGRAVALVQTVAIEARIGKKLDPKYEGYIHAGGMILLLLLMAAIMLKDVIFLFK
jgi:regulator of sigma E protease